tara:strand:- start:4361 stop:5152 length:792 start_codon:yes stop_codon:yes gene_type:complete
MILNGHFIESTMGRVFLTVTGPLPARKAVLCLPPLFEEMNLSRAVMAGQARYFAAHGITSCVLDYYGTGDSEGDVESVSTETWLEDVLAAGGWLQQQGVDSLMLWGVRFGGLLQLHYQRRLHEALPVSNQLLWSPIASGKRYVKQLMRLKQAGSLMRGDGKKFDWRQHIAAGETVEVAGYPLNNRLLASIESLEVSDRIALGSSTLWLELGGSEVSPGTTSLVATWPSDSYHLRALPSPLFWQIPETFSVPEIYPQALSEVKF